MIRSIPLGLVVQCKDCGENATLYKDYGVICPPCLERETAGNDGVVPQMCENCGEFPCANYCVNPVALWDGGDPGDREDREAFAKK